MPLRCMQFLNCLFAPGHNTEKFQTNKGQTYNILWQACLDHLTESSIVVALVFEGWAGFNRTS